jgi:hypothetical protein
LSILHEFITIILKAFTNFLDSATRVTAIGLMCPECIHVMLQGGSKRVSFWQQVQRKLKDLMIVIIIFEA